jgi:hypothetical protein
MKTQTFLQMFVLALLSVPSPAGGSGPQKPGLAVVMGPTGLKSLSYSGQELIIVPTSFGVIGVTGADGKPMKVSLAAAGAVQAAGVITQKYDVLTVLTQMRQDKDVLNLAVTFKNTGKQSIANADYHAMLLHFPKRPKGLIWKWGYTVKVDTDDAPGVIEADWGTDKLVVCVDPGTSDPGAEDTARPMTIEFTGNYGDHTNNALVFRTAFNPVLQPGKAWTFRGSLRFASSQTPLTEAAGGIFEKFAKAYPPLLKWPDRRPLGAIMLANSAQNWPSNPRGWFNDPKVDVTNPAGKAAFGDRLMRFADGSIAELKRIGAQGMVCWDIEGDEMPHAITYLGDPRILPRAAPEMDAVADAFFKRFLDAGLRTGVCIRPSRVIPNLKGGWKHQQVEDHVSDLADKIAYAKRRWGCTIFYMDTNVKWPMNPDPADITHGMWQGEAKVLPSSDLRELCRRHPDVLIFPEFARFGYYGVCGVYGELRGTMNNVNPAVRTVYPEAMQVLRVIDGDFLGNWDELLAGVMGGAVHIFYGMFPDPRNVLVMRLYKEADFERRSSSVSKSGSLNALVNDADPLVRYTAVSRLGRPTGAETAVLIKAFRLETDWVVERKIVAALGGSGTPEAAGLLASLVYDARRELDFFAASALGRMGRPATPILTKLAINPDARVAMLALTALTQFDDPAATVTLLKLSNDRNAVIRGVAARALGRRPAPAVTTRLLAMLPDKDPTVVIAACNALEQVKDRRATKPLVELIVRSVTQMHNNDIRLAAGDALEAITGKEYSVFHDRWKKALDDSEF